MSIFSGEFDPLPWLQEKTLHALQAAVSLVDVANEPDTTGWYKRKLLRTAELLIDRLAPVVAFLNKAGSEAADREEWGAVLEGGSFALANWCRKWKIGDPTNIAKGALLHLRTVEEDDEKAEELEDEPFQGDLEAALDLKLQIYGFMSRRLLDQGLSPPAHRLLLWLLGSLWLSDPPDVVGVSRRFLPTDIGVKREEASSAYKELYDKGLVERIDSTETDKRPDRLSLRLVVRGLNDSKHAAPYREEEFGYPGARIAGKVTSGQGKFIQLPKTLSAMLGRWFKEAQDLTDLRDFLQAQLGEDKVYVERAEVQYQEEAPILLVHFRYPLDADLEPLEKELSDYAEQWLKQRLVRHTANQ
ncbi:MAG TPA: hypothetical protein V6D08_21170 [Candidatus Obscuribacterales bacterium]